MQNSNGISIITTAEPSSSFACDRNKLSTYNPTPCPTPTNKQTQPLWHWIKSHKHFLTALLVGLMLCAPGNIVTFILFHEVYSSQDGDDQVLQKLLQINQLTVYDIFTGQYGARDRDKHNSPKFHML